MEGVPCVPSSPVVQHQPPDCSSTSPNSEPEEPSPPSFDSFRLLKRYHTPATPKHDPDAVLTSVERYDSKSHLTNPDEIKEAESEDAKLLAPFPNISSFELGEWFYGQRTQKSLNNFKALVRILTDPTFSIEDIKKTHWDAVFQDLGKNKEAIDPRKSEWVDDSGWKTTEVKIDVPVHHRMEQGHGVEAHVVGTLHHRSIVSILEEKVKNPPGLQYLHLDGHELIWQPDPAEGSAQFRVVSELYNSDAFLLAEQEIRDHPPPEIEDCKLPRVVVGLQFWSDATHLSTFSSSKLWPLYMVFANESKYRRGTGPGESCYHVAYLDSVSMAFSNMTVFLMLPFWSLDIRRFQGLSYRPDWRESSSPPHGPSQPGVLP